MRSASPENVSDLIAKPVEKYDPEPRYVSKYREKIIKASKRGKSAHKTLGVPSVVLDPPDQYLKKRASSAPRKPQAHHEHYRRPDYQRKLPEWKPIRASDMEKSDNNLVDYAKRNIEEAKNRRPTKARKYYVDDRHGNSQSLKLSGLYPFYRNRKSYGQIPGNGSRTYENHSSPRQGSSPQRARKAENKSKGSGKHEELPRQGTKKQEEFSRQRNKKHEESPRRKTKNHVESPRQKTKNHVESPRQKTKNHVESPRQKTKNHVDPLRQKTKKHEESPGRTNEKREKSSTTIPQSEDEFNERKLRGSREEITTRREDQSQGERKINDIKNRDKNIMEDARSESKSLRAKENDRVSTASSIVPIDYQQPRCRYVTEDERSELLYGMKKKWDEMMKQFQCLPFVTDTPPKVKRRSQMEKDLLRLEKDIETIERHPYIYVYSDPED